MATEAQVNGVKKPSRFIVALILAVIYSLITMSPLAPLVTKSPSVAHAITGECSGNCDICGCSAERRASHTCCCWMNKLKHQHERGNLPDCCKNKKRHKMTMLTCNCPCGGNKAPVLSGFENSEQLPYGFTHEAISLLERTLFFSHADRLADLHGAPPLPPPKLLFYSEN
jgi:hypothetical protein